MHPSRRTAARRRAGFTLVEVMIALVIFVIGAIAILRIFPPALGVIQNSESSAIATRMGKSTIARFDTAPNLVPDAVFNADYLNPANDPITGWKWSDARVGNSTFPIAPIGTASRLYALPSDITPGAFNSSSLSHFRHINGERHALAAGAGNGLFVLSQYPYATAADTLNPAGALYVFREDTVIGVKLQPDGSLDFSNATLGSDPTVPFMDTDGTVGHTIRPPRDMRNQNANAGSPPGPQPGDVTYYVSYSWRQKDAAGSERVDSVTDEPIAIPTDTNYPAGGDPKVVNQGDAGVLPGTVPVRFRMLIQITTAPDSAGGVYDGLDDQRGFVHVTANGRSAAPSTTFPPAKDLQAGDTVSLDYDVKDWRWIVHDDAPTRVPDIGPTPPPGSWNNNAAAVTLTARPISTELQTQVYSLLAATDPANNGTADLFRMTWDGVNNQATGPGTDAQRLLQVLPKQGRVIFGTGLGSSTALIAPHARDVYMGLDGWTHQVIVGAKNYVPFQTTTPANTTINPSEPWREYLWTGPTNTSPGNADTLYFHPSEAGKTILVSFEYLDGTVYRSVVGSVITISQDLVGSPVSGFGAFVVPAQIVDLTGRVVPGATAINSVQGIGLRARTAWIDNGRYQQASVGGYRTVTD